MTDMTISSLRLHFSCGQSVVQQSINWFDTNEPKLFLTVPFWSIWVNAICKVKLIMTLKS